MFNNLCDYLEGYSFDWLDNEIPISKLYIRDICKFALGV